MNGRVCRGPGDGARVHRRRLRHPHFQPKLQPACLADLDLNHPPSALPVFPVARFALGNPFNRRGQSFGAGLLTLRLDDPLDALELKEFEVG